MESTTQKLVGKKVAILATNGFEESELLVPRKALEDAGADVEVLSLEPGSIMSWKDKNWGSPLPVFRTVREAISADYDALVLPGGVINADTLRMDKDAIDFVSAIIDTGKPIAAICHGSWILIETDRVEGRTMTSWPSLKKDLENAGALWVDRAVVTDHGWVTSRKPEDLPDFCRKMVEEFTEGEHFERIAS